MKFDSGIYSEIQSCDISEFLDDNFDSYEYDNQRTILDEMNARDQFGKPYDELTDDELDELNYDNLIKIKCIDIDTLLFKGLAYWFGNWTNVVNSVRSGYYDTENARLCYGTGIGYDTISSDLLCCECDGTACSLFIDFLNENEEVMKKGGYEYMKSKNKEHLCFDRLKNCFKNN